MKTLNVCSTSPSAGQPNTFTQVSLSSLTQAGRHNQNFPDLLWPLFEQWMVSFLIIFSFISTNICLEWMIQVSMENAEDMTYHCGWRRKKTLCTINNINPLCISAFFFVTKQIYDDAKITLEEWIYVRCIRKKELYSKVWTILRRS